MLRLTEEELAAIVERHRPKAVRLMSGEETGKQPKPSKYRNRSADLDGMKFASRKERDRYAELVLMERAGEIRDLRRQVPFDLQVNGHHICRYIADFVYRTREDTLVVEDVKGYVNTANAAYRIFRIKKALMRAVLNIDVKEI